MKANKTVTAGNNTMDGNDEEGEEEDGDEDEDLRDDDEECDGAIEMNVDNRHSLK
jgi:hypothetical protein